MLFILEGEARLAAENKEFKAGPMIAVYIPPGKLHGLENTGDKPLNI